MINGRRGLRSCSLPWAVVLAKATCYDTPRSSTTTTGCSGSYHTSSPSSLLPSQRSSWEVSIGQAYRGGTVIAFNNINRRLKGVGIGPVFVSLIVVQYFTVNLAWIMTYFRHSFTSPLPWEGQVQDFYMGTVIDNPDPVAGNLTAGNAAVSAYTEYLGVGVLGETVGWSAFVWFLIWISIFRGVGMTGRVVYFTMGLPIITTIIFVGRAVSLPNASAGINLLWRTWRGDQLASGTVWQTAVGQVFFSTGIGFGYFTSYASYNAKHSNAVMDANLICSSNVLFGAFVVGFLTLPEAVIQMPGANFWAVLLFFTLIVLGFSSAFVMLDVVATLIVDSGLKVSRPVVVTALTLISFLMCLPYCTEFGFYLLDSIDRWINNVALIFVVWSEVVSSTTVYRWEDVVSQTGLPAFIVYNVGCIGGQILGVSVAHGSGHPEAGAGAGFGLYIVCSLVAVLIAKTPDSAAARFWMVNTWSSRFWYLASYSVSRTFSRTWLGPDLANNIITGQPTPTRPEPGRRPWQKLEDTRLLAGTTPIYQRSGTVHHLQLRIPRVLYPAV